MLFIAKGVRSLTHILRARPALRLEQPCQSLLPRAPEILHVVVCSSGQISSNSGPFISKLPLQLYHYPLFLGRKLASTLKAEKLIIFSLNCRTITKKMKEKWGIDYVFKSGLSLLTQRRRQDFPDLGRRPLDRMELQSRGPYLCTCSIRTSSSSAIQGPFRRGTEEVETISLRPIVCN